MLESVVKLLIVDDDEAIRFSLCQIFLSMGHKVRTAEDGFSALQQIRELNPDILLSDLNMPGMSGFELLSVVRRQFPAIYVIAMSGAFRGQTVPYAVAADGFHEKTTGLPSLFKNFQDGVSHEAAALRGCRTVTPIWIPPMRSDAAKKREVLIGCPECMRAFPQTYLRHGLIEETGCAHCGTAIQYAVVDSVTTCV
jgi:CheY-like chemotaxis protein